MTNFERIKAMNIDEFAEWLSDDDLRDDCAACIYEYDEECCSECIKGRKAWLEQESVCARRAQFAESRLVTRGQDND